MIFNKHSEIEGQHAFLGASKWHWLNYDEKKLIEAYLNSRAVQRGIELHAYAAESIRLRQKLAKNKQTLNRYVNDGIAYMMSPEQKLYLSRNCFGTADSISFRDGLLRIHDYKSGISPAHMEQLYIYAALFCLEYDFKPKDISIETRIYQSGRVWTESPPPGLIKDISDKMVHDDQIIEKLREEET